VFRKLKIILRLFFLNVEKVTKPKKLKKNIQIFHIKNLQVKPALKKPVRTLDKNRSGLVENFKVHRIKW
jgi:hypothetical protein